MKQRPGIVSRLATVMILSFGIASAAFSAGLKEVPYVATQGDRNWENEFDISGKKPGTYNIIVEGKDSAGNVSLAGPINVYVDPDSDLPIITLANPLQLMRVGGDLNIVGTCVDDDAVGRVEISVDGGDWIPAIGKDFWSWYIKAGEIPDGRRVIKARGVDVNGLVGPERSVVFNMDKNKPLATVSSHVAASLVAGKVELKGSVYDANGVEKVEFSLDGGKHYLEAPGSFDKKTFTRSFKAPFDSRTLKDGPTAILIRAVDGVASVGITPFLLVVDNTKPTVALVSPGETDTVDGEFTLFGIAGDEVGLAAASWKIGELGGEIPLTPGDPYWTVPVSLPQIKGKTLELVIQARDTIGNTTEIKRKILVDLEKDRPVVTLVEPKEKASSDGSILLSGSARDDDAVQAVEYWLDKGSPVRVDSTGSFQVAVEGISAGAHSLTVRAIDIKGVTGPDVSVNFTDHGAAPSLSIAEVVYASQGRTPEPFTAGRELAPDSGASLRVAASGGEALTSLSWKIGNLEDTISSKGAGTQNFLVPLPKDGPYGILPVSLVLTDAAGRTASVSSHVYVTNYSKIRGDPGFVFADERLGADGSFAFGADKKPLVGRFVGAALSKVTLDPPSKAFKVSTDGQIVTVEAVEDGLSAPMALVGTTDRGHQFRSSPFTFNADTSGPALSLAAVPSFVKGTVALSGTAQDVSSVKEVRWSSGEAGGTIPVASGKFQASIDLSPLPDGPQLITVIAVDAAGNQSLQYASVLKDTAGPEFSIAFPRSDAPGSLIAGSVRDPAGLSKLLLAEDGTSFKEVDARESFILKTASADPSKARLKAVDKAGNETVIPVEFLIASSSVTYGSPVDPKALPSVTILSPASNTELQAPLILHIDSPREVASIEWAAGTAKGSLSKGDLVEEGSYSIAAVPLEAWAVKSGPVTVSASVTDVSGKKGSAKALVNVAVEPSLPSARIILPAEGAPLSPSFDVALTASSRSGLGALKVTVDGAGRDDLTTSSGATFRLEGLASGKHTIAVTPVDQQGRAGKALSRTVTVLGNVPAIAMDSFTRKTGSDPFVTGAPQVLAEPSALSGTVNAANGLESLSVAFGDRAAAPATIKKLSATEFSWSVPVPDGLPFASIPVKIEAKDTVGRIGNLSRFFFRVSSPSAESAVFDAEGLRGNDARIIPGAGPEGSSLVRLFDGETLSLRFNGRPIASVAVDDKEGLASASFEGPIVTVKGEKEGLGRKTQVKVKTVDGDEFTWGPISFAVDAGKPAFDLASPASGAWYAGSAPFSAVFSDPNGIASVRCSLDGQTWNELSFDAAAPAPAKATGKGKVAETAKTAKVEEALAPGSKTTAIPLTMEDGAVVARFQVEDRAGRVTEIVRTFNKDATPPSGTIILPRQSDKVNGRTTSGALFSDNGCLTALEFSEDSGKTWIPAEKLPTQTRTVDFSVLARDAKLIYRATDAAGNKGEAVPLFTVDYEADKPRTVIQLPSDNEVLRADWTISGAVYDDDRADKLFWRVDGGPWTELAITGNSFSIPFTLAASLDNEHLFEAYALDMYGVKGDISSRKYRISKEDPKAQMLVPALDRTVRGIIDISGEASDKNAIDGLEISFDNAVAFHKTVGAEKWTYRFDTTNLKDGLHSIYIRPTDKYDTEGFFATLISIDNTPPDINLDLPLDGATSDHKLQLSGRVSDDRQLEFCEAVVFSRGTANLEKHFPLPLDPVIAETLDLSSLPDGEYGVRIFARDRAGNETLSSRDFYHKAGWKDEGIYIATPVRGEHVKGLFRIQGHLHTPDEVASVSILIDGKVVAPATPDKFGWFCVDLDPAALTEGSLSLEARFTTSAGRSVTSEKVPLDWKRTGAWISTASFTGGAFIPARPWLKGQVGYVFDPILPEAVADDPANPMDEKTRAVWEKASLKKAEADEKTAEKGREVVLVEISVDNGRTFQKAKGKENWKFRLQTQDYPEGPLPLVLRATYRNGEVAVSKVLLNLDKTAPVVKLLKPAEGGRFNEKFQSFGTASDDVDLTSVRIALRDGDKSGYKLPSFIQGLYLESGFMGDTLWDIGAGLTFFDDNVKLQFCMGNLPQDYQSISQRFYGTTYSAKLLANIFTFPFAYAFGPDWDFLEGSIAVGAKFSYFNETSSGSPLMLSAVLFQLEFPKFTIDDWVMFRSYSFFTEYQAWFISAEINGGVESRFSVGIRTSVF